MAIYKAQAIKLSYLQDIGNLVAIYRAHVIKLSQLQGIYI